MGGGRGFGGNGRFGSTGHREVRSVAADQHSSNFIVLQLVVCFLETETMPNIGALFLGTGCENLSVSPPLPSPVAGCCNKVRVGARRWRKQQQ